MNMVIIMYFMHYIDNQTDFCSLLRRIREGVVMIYPRRRRLRRPDVVDVFGAGSKFKLLRVITLPNLQGLCIRA